jgi:hypothetical protein
LVFRRQRGGHTILRREKPPARVVVPDHKEVRLGTLRRIIADAGLGGEEFLWLLRGWCAIPTNSPQIRHPPRPFQ